MEPISFIIGLAVGVVGDRFVPNLSKKVQNKFTNWLEKRAEKKAEIAEETPSKKSRKKATAGAAA